MAVYGIDHFVLPVSDHRRWGQWMVDVLGAVAVSPDALLDPTLPRER